jgi:hypothetical protein
MAEQTLTLASIEALAEDLRKTPDLPKAMRTLTKKEAILALKPAIEELRDRGFSVEQIAKLLTEKGLSITFGSLRQYLADKQGGSRGKKKKATTTPQQTTSVVGGTPQASRQASVAAETSAGPKDPRRPAKADGKAPSGPSGKPNDKKGSGFEIREDTKDI